MKHRTYLTALFTAALVGMPLGFFVMRLPAAPPSQPAEARLPAILKAKPLKPGPGDDELRKLLIARYNTAVAEMAARYTEFLAGRTPMEDFVAVARRLVHSGVEVSDQPADQLAFREQFLELAKEVEKAQQARHEAGRISVADAEGARYLRLDAEIEVLKAKRKAAGQRPK